MLSREGDSVLIRRLHALRRSLRPSRQQLRKDWRAINSNRQDC
jgi:hypothetical protein